MSANISFQKICPLQTTLPEKKQNISEPDPLKVVFQKLNLKKIFFGQYSSQVKIFLSKTGPSHTPEFVKLEARNQSVMVLKHVSRSAGDYLLYYCNWANRGVVNRLRLDESTLLDFSEALGQISASDIPGFNVAGVDDHFRFDFAPNLFVRKVSEPDLHRLPGSVPFGFDVCVVDRVLVEKMEMQQIANTCQANQTKSDDFLTLHDHTVSTLEMLCQKNDTPVQKVCVLRAMCTKPQEEENKLFDTRVRFFNFVTKKSCQCPPIVPNGAWIYGKFQYFVFENLTGTVPLDSVLEHRAQFSSARARNACVEELEVLKNIFRPSIREGPSTGCRFGLLGSEDDLGDTAAQILVDTVSGKIYLWNFFNAICWLKNETLTLGNRDRYFQGSITQNASFAGMSKTINLIKDVLKNLQFNTR